MAISRDTVGIWLDIIRERYCYKVVNNLVKQEAKTRISMSLL